MVKGGKKGTPAKKKRSTGGSKGHGLKRPTGVAKRSTVSKRSTVAKRKRPAGAVKRVSVSQRLKQKEERRQRRRAYAAPATAAAATAEAADVQVQLETLSQRMEGLYEAASLEDIHRDLEDVDSALATLPAEIEAIRARGYVFRSFLERKAQVLADQWADMRDRVVREIERRSRELEQDIAEAERALQSAQSGGSTQIARAESAIRMLESKVSAAQDSIEAMFDTFDDNVAQTQAQVEAVEWALDQADQASFDFYPGEDLVAACQAQFLETKKDGPKGVLFLTDGRLIFEQKEEVATKKVLFITTEKETVQELVFEVPIGHVEEVKASQAGFLGHKEMLEVRFAPEADISEARLRLLGADNEEWAGLIGRVRSGDIEKERTQPKEEEAVEEAREAPTKCPTCGALLTATVVKGMREITCEYCGTVIRL